MKIILFVPYFGKLPAYFPAFVHSCGPIADGIDIQVFTDDETIKSMKLPSNVRYDVWPFDKMKDLVKQKIGNTLFSAYKLCDYKPCYGNLFSEFTEGYEYWGYCDVDMMFGDMVAYLHSINYRQYDRIGRYGHFTIYRNTDEIRQLYRTEIKDAGCTTRFSYVSDTTYPCNFDEQGMNRICNAKGIRFWEDSSLLNTSYGYKHLHTWQFKNDYQVWTWEDGHVCAYSYGDNREIIRTEASYLHFMMHKLELKTALSSNLLITHEGIEAFLPENLHQILAQRGRGDTENEHLQVIRDLKKKGRTIAWQRVCHEVSACGLIKAASNIILRAMTVL